MQRDLINVLEQNLEKDEINIVIGARQTGKTTVIRQLEKMLKSLNKQTFFLNLEDPDYLKMLNDSPKNLFTIFPISKTAKSFLFIDEIQYLQNPTNFLKYFYDEYKGIIKIIASGSSAFYIDTKFKDSLAGRKKIFNLPTLSFKEFLKFKGFPELYAADFNYLSLSEKEKIAPLFYEYMIYGGYPKVILAESLEEKIDILQDIAYSYIKKDVFESGIRQDDVFFRLLKILASQIGSLLNANELGATLGISKTAIDNYLLIMQKSFHISLLRPFFTNIRKELSKMPKIYFNDTGLRNFFKNDYRQFIDRDDRGELLENMFFRKLLDSYDLEQIKFWRTADQKEVDFVVNGKNAYEIKTQMSSVKKSKYQLFIDSYPEINFKFVSLDIIDAESVKPWENV